MEVLKKINVAILIVSDTRSKGEREDKTTSLIQNEVVNYYKNIENVDVDIIFKGFVPDEKEDIKNKLLFLSDELKADLILTSGGTGLTPRDVTPDATRIVIEKEIPGIPEAARTRTFKNAKTAILSRGVAGTRDKSLIINLPGNPEGVKEWLDIILEVAGHAIETIKGLTS